MVLDKYQSFEVYLIQNDFFYNVYFIKEFVLKVNYILPGFKNKQISLPLIQIDGKCKIP